MEKQGSYFGNLLSATFSLDFLFENFPNHMNHSLLLPESRRESHVKYLTAHASNAPLAKKKRAEDKEKCVSSMLQSASLS